MGLFDSVCTVRSVFQKIKMKGFMMKYKKYRAVNTWPNISYGASTGRPPIQVRSPASATRNQNMI